MKWSLLFLLIICVITYVQARRWGSQLWSCVHHIRENLTAIPQTAEVTKVTVIPMSVQ